MEEPARRKPVVDQIFGDNKAPVATVLDADFAELVQKVADAEAMCKEANTKPKNDAEQAALGDKIVDLRRLFARIDGTRTDEKAPILDAGRELDGWFNALKARIEVAVKPLSEGADTYVREKAAAERARQDKIAQDAREKAEAERRKAEQAKTPEAAGNAAARADNLEAKADQAEAASVAGGRRDDRRQREVDLPLHGLHRRRDAPWRHRSLLQAGSGGGGPDIHGAHPQGRGEVAGR